MKKSMIFCYRKTKSHFFADFLSCLDIIGLLGQLHSSWVKFYPAASVFLPLGEET